MDAPCKRVARRCRGLVFLVLLLGLVPALAHGATTGRFELRGVVTRVVDGDTVDVRLDRRGLERVRLIGIDTPEVGTCGAAPATAAAVRLAGGRRVVLRGDATQATRDR
jgi:endonuclease YncB( thermonuclease family)